VLTNLTGYVPPVVYVYVVDDVTASTILSEFKYHAQLLIFPELMVEVPVRIVGFKAHTDVALKLTVGNGYTVRFC
jgi:hypothetical protein